MRAVEASPNRRMTIPYCGTGGEGHMSGTSKLWMALLTVVVWALAATAAQAQTTIKAGDAAWQPAEVTVPTGATVRWEFDQTTLPHTVTSTSPNWTKDEARDAGGAAVTHTFDAPGIYTFRCNLHGGMTGTITVESDEPDDVLVFSRTTGFRHESAIAAGRTAIQQMGDVRGLQRHAQRGPDAVHRCGPAPVRGRRLPQHRRRGHPQRRPAQRLRALDAARRRHREHPRRRSTPTATGPGRAR